MILPSLTYSLTNISEFRGHLYHVVFSENYRKVKVIDASDLSEVDSFVLMENANPIE